MVFGGSKVTSAGVASSIGLLTALLVLVFFVEASANVVSAATTTSSPATLFDLLRFFYCRVSRHLGKVTSGRALHREGRMFLEGQKETRLDASRLSGASKLGFRGRQG